MKINTSAPASAPTTDQPVEVENESAAENGSADFSALLFLMLATPQMQPAALPTGDTQSAPGAGSACADGLCTLPVPLAQTAEGQLPTNLLSDGNAGGENLAAALPLTGFERATENPLANVAGAETPQVVLPVATQQAAADAVTEQPVSDVSVPATASPATQNPTGAVDAAKQLADAAAEAARLERHEDDPRINPLLQREGLTTHDGANQAIAGVATEEGLDGAGVKDAHDKEMLEKKRDHSLVPDHLSTSFAAALHGGAGVQRHEGAAAAFAAPVIDRVANEIATQVRTHQNEAVIVLEPPELGSLRIALTLDGDKVQARIIAEMHDSGNLIQNHLPELQEALSNHRLDLVDVHIDSGNWNSASNDLSQNFSNREFTDQRQSRGGREASDRPLTDNAPVAPLMAPVQPTRARTARVSMWA